MARRSLRVLFGGSNQVIFRHRVRGRLFGAGAHAARARHPRRVRPAQICERQAGQGRPVARPRCLTPLPRRGRLSGVLYLIFGSALAVYGVLVGSLYVFQRHLLYFPGGGRPVLGELATFGVREVGVTTSDGLSLLSWYLPPRAGHPAIAYFHGNGGHIGYRAERLRWFARYAYGVLMLEYRGYGGNPGASSEAGFYADGAASLDFLASCGITLNRIVLYGESLGSGVAVRLAAQREIAGLILEAPFTSVAEVAQYHYSFIPAAAMVWDRFDSLS